MRKWMQKTVHSRASSPWKRSKSFSIFPSIFRIQSRWKGKHDAWKHFRILETWFLWLKSGIPPLHSRSPLVSLHNFRFVSSFAGMLNIHRFSTFQMVPSHRIGSHHTSPPFPFRPDAWWLPVVTQDDRGLASRQLDMFSEQFVGRGESVRRTGSTSPTGSSSSTPFPCGRHEFKCHFCV